jgi:uncharacterized membrane protein YhfC
MEIKIPGMTMAMMGVAGVLGLCIPVALYIFLRKKKGADHMPFWIGAAVFVVFAMLLEKTVLYFLSQTGGWKDLQGNLWLYAIVGGLFAGVFEETGRFAAMKTVLKNKRGNDANALMYGAGHGGIEVVILLSLTMINNLVLCALANSGNMALVSAGGPAVTQMVQGFATVSPLLFLLGVVERIGAVALHMSLSVLVWFAVKNRRQWFLYPAAVLIHAVADAVAVILAGSGTNMLLIECAIYAMTGLTIWAAVAVWKNNKRTSLAQPAVAVQE